MKKEELRIGNYFTDKTGSPFKLKQMDFEEDGEDCTLVYGDALDGKYIWIEYAKPIPLTEEWLLRFGFEKIFNAPAPHFSYRKPLALNWKKEPSCYFRVVDFEYSATGEHWRGWLLPLTDGEYFMSQKNVEIEDVHQLQNLYFALTGKELEIK